MRRDVLNELQFENVEFEYREGRPVVLDFNVTVPGGSVIALVGRSGAGKTTVTDLVARFHDPTKGRILLNGADIRDFRLRTYRDLLAIVQQEVFLFDGSVRDNIAYGRHDATDEDVEDAARRANAHEFIEKLPEGYDTFIGERGVKLSGGQCQRLAIARAVLASPQILILDEATSNLDTESEQLIQASMASLLAGRTTFVIAHRLSTIRRADLILLTGGRPCGRARNARGAHGGARRVPRHGATPDGVDGARAWSRPGSRATRELARCSQSVLRFRHYCVLTTVTSNTSVEFDGMGARSRFGPYPRLEPITRRRLPPTRMPTIPRSQPAITCAPWSVKVNGVFPMLVSN